METSELTECYLKLKNYIYHDKSLLYVKERIALFEIDGKANERIASLKTAIDERDEPYFSALMTGCRFHEVPKDLTFASDNIDFVTNNVYDDKWTLDSTNSFFDIPVELHILNVFWIIKSLYLLDNKVSKSSFGYRLEIKDEKVKRGKKLFQPYFENYTRWLRGGFNLAKNLSKSNKSFLLITLDIKRFFYSVRISKADLQEAVEANRVEITEKDDFIAQINFRLHDLWKERHNSGLDEDEFSLPLGLLSSGILANWHLQKLDGAITEKLSPEYYGRYVDDMIIVKSVKKQQDFSSTKDIINKTFVQTGVFRESLSGHDYQISSYDSLRIQYQKVKAFVFHGKESLARIEHIAASVISNSSEFNLMPDIQNIFSQFDQLPLDIKIDGAGFKLRDIEDIVNDRFKVSQLLSRVLALHKHCNLTGKEKFRVLIGFQRIFKGKHIILLRPLWTQYLTLITIQESKRNLEIFLIRLNNLLNSLQNDRENKHAIDSIVHDTTISLKIALSGNLDFYENFLTLNGEKLNGKYPFIRRILDGLNKDSLLQYRRSFLINFQLFRTPGVFLYTYFYDYTGNLYLKSPNAEVASFASKTQLTFLPKYVQFLELYLALLFRRIYRGDFNKITHQKTNGAAIALYWRLNFRGIFPISFFQQIKSQYFEHAPNENRNGFLVQKITSRPDLPLNDTPNPKIAIPNHRIDLAEVRGMLTTSYRSQLNYQKFLQVGAAINEAVANGVDFLVFPELAIPIEFLSAILRISEFFQITIVAGLEYMVINGTALNLSITILPGKRDSFKYVNIFPRLKNYYAPAEIQLIRERNFQIPATVPHQYFLFKWHGARFTVFNCFELANIADRSYFKGKIDFLITVLFNRDRHYYESIAQSAAIDLHCYLVNVNTSVYKGTFAIQPASTNIMYLAELKGGENSTILVTTLDIERLRTFQRSYVAGAAIPENGFKPLPPQYIFDTERL
jgi:predicted amidohydrolase